MESKNILLKNTCKIQSTNTVISKMHNMQWLKNTAPLPGHVKPRTNKGTVQSLKENIETNEVTNKSAISFSNIPVIDLKLVNSTNATSTISDSKQNCDIDNKMDENTLVLENKENTWDINDKMTHSAFCNDQALILQKLEEEEMISMAMADSLITSHLEAQLRLEEQEKEKEQGATECDLTSLEIKDSISETSQENIHDNNNNNDKLNFIRESDLIHDVTMKNDVRSDTILNEGANKEDQSNNISLNKETGTSLNLNDSNKISVTNDNTSTPTPPTTSNSNDKSIEVHKNDVKQSLEKKEVPKVITRKNVPTSTLNKNNNVILRQGIESKMKQDGIKHSVKTESTEIAKKTQDKRDYQPNQSVSSTPKGLRVKSNLQPKRESMVTKHSSEIASRYATKNLKESEQNKTTPSSVVSKQYKVHRMCYTYKKEENVSMSKLHNTSSKTIQRATKEINNYSSLPNSVQSTNKRTLNKVQTHSTDKKILETSNVDTKSENIEQNMTLKSDQVATTLVSEKECVNKSDVKDKLSVDTTDKEINTFSNEVKESSEGSTNEHSTNEYVERISTNPFLPNVPNLPIVNNLQTDTKDVKDIVQNDLCSKSTQLEYTPEYVPNNPYVYHVPQQNVHQEEILSHQNFAHYIPNQFIMDCSVNTALPNFHSNVPHSNANTMHLNQYENVQTTSNKPSNSQLPNSSSPNVLPSNTENVNMLQYQMPNFVSYGNQNMLRSPPGFCIYPMMSQEEQFNLQTYGLSPAYFMNPVCVCRNDCYTSHPQNWNSSNNYPVPLLQSPYQVNCNSFCNQHVQPSNMFHNNIASIRPIHSRTRVPIPHEQNWQRNYEKPASNSVYNIRSSQNNKRYNTNLQAHGNITNTRENIDFKKEKQEGEFLNDKETNNLPMISPKACMIYGSGFPTSTNSIRPQIKHSETTVQYHKNNGCRYVSREHLSSNAGIGRGKTKYTKPNQSYKAQY
ncbi:hypothetical protein KPH14_008849 [Odynerus spinipes]|uniref:Uncharacterized protein n=1 Tax=Odynerus spinipes TaxID=1348599 RepID=A0AAD9R8P2_9HYME|nr:hypothetical protein KPH14_008849 [Odynerus spinipes]